MLEKKISNSFPTDLYITDEKMYKHLYQIPQKIERTVALSTEITIFENGERLVQIALFELKNGCPTGLPIDKYFCPTIIKDKIFTQEMLLFEDYTDGKNHILILLRFIENSIIFVHNAPQDILVLNNELNFWGLS